jgi:hypothetical protein
MVRKDDIGASFNMHGREMQIKFCRKTRSKETSRRT